MMLVHNYPQQNEEEYDQEEEEESYEDEDGEYEEDIEEGVPCESDIDNNEFYPQQQKNNRYACPQVILETVEQESDECRSSI